MTGAAYATLEDLSADIEAMGGLPPDYWDRMMHTVPVVPVVDRVAFILERCRGKDVLNFGCASGGVHRQIKEVATSAVGIDHEKPCDHLLDLDAFPLQFPLIDPPDLIVCGEILEHLCNPGNFLRSIRACWAAPILITTPNAGSAALTQNFNRGIENVNADHCCWFSWRTMTTLLGKCGLAVAEWYWHNGKPLTAEGLVFVVN